jgi:hypothetical protein
MGRACGTWGEGQSIWGLVEKCERNGLHGRPRHRWEDNIKMDFKGIGWDGVDWIHLSVDKDKWWAVVNMVMNLQVS